MYYITLLLMLLFSSLPDYIIEYTIEKRQNCLCIYFIDLTILFETGSHYVVFAGLELPM